MAPLETEAGIDVVTYPYIWVWRRRTYFGAKVPCFSDGSDRAGQHCRVIARGKLNNAWIEFEDGYQVVTSRGGLRKRKS